MTKMEETMEMDMELSGGEAPSGMPPCSSAVNPTYASASGFGTHVSEPFPLPTEDVQSKMGQISGYVFMCNGRTKPECYRYRVFGLPKGKKEIVKKIKPGMKLFLFDFERKLLYGLYEATCGGKLNIEPGAFDGKYPAQVGFKICKDCYPLPEGSFKPAIQDNYSGTKFKQELTYRQVMNLLSLFRSINETSPAVPLTLPYASAQSVRVLCSVENQFHPQAGVPASDDQYTAARQFKNAQPASEPGYALPIELQNNPYGQSLSTAGTVLKNEPSHAVTQHVALEVSSIHHSYYGQSTYNNPSMEPQVLPNKNQYYSSAAQQPPLLENHQSLTQDPHLKYLDIISNIRRYGGAQETYSNSHLSSASEYYHPTQQRESTLMLQHGGCEAVQQPVVASDYYHYSYPQLAAVHTTESPRSHSQVIGCTSQPVQSHVNLLGTAEPANGNISSVSNPIYYTYPAEPTSYNQMD